MPPRNSRLHRRMRPLLFAARLGWLLAAASGQAADRPEPETAAVTEAPRRLRFALRELDRFLDHHPLVEDDLRQDPARVRNAAYLRDTPELRDLLASNPSIGPALRQEPRHFLHRALLRQAGSPLRRADVLSIDPLLDREADLERALTENPARIRDAAFVAGHAPLRDFLAAHPTLSRAFLPAKAATAETATH